MEDEELVMMEEDERRTLTKQSWKMSRTSAAPFLRLALMALWTWYLTTFSTPRHLLS
jgi:hypothetical protein